MRRFEELEAVYPMEDQRSGRGVVWAILVAFLAGGMLAGFGWWYWHGPETVSEAEAVVVTPPRPEGLTILVKQKKADATRPKILNRELDGFALDLGTAGSFSALSERFARISADNAELGLDALEPRATLVESSAGLEVRLLVGPLQSGEAAEEICRNIALPAGIRCHAAGFAGEQIARE